MADQPINLNKVRKARARVQARAQADRNAVVHGLSGAEKQRTRAEAHRLRRLQDAGKRGSPDTEPAPQD